MRILGFETTCDETSAAVVENGMKVISNVVSSSQDFHKKYGGVVPEVAAREQVRTIIPVVKEALLKARVSNPAREVDAIAVAYGPGLIGSLLVGVESAKTMAIVWNKPLVPVNHLVGHVYANWIQVTKPQYSKSPKFPLIALIVSGGHTDLVLMTDHGKYKWLGGTLDDAAGEAFDKVARVLGLGYPGGPEIERVAGAKYLVTGNQAPATKYHLPRPMIKDENFDFSFSGLKTAVVNLVHSLEIIDHRKKTEIASEFQNAVVDVLVEKTIRAAKKYRVTEILVGGGVAANSELKHRMSKVGLKNKFSVRFPSTDLSVDNGAMIAACAFYNFNPVKIESLQAQSGLYFS